MADLTIDGRAVSARVVKLRAGAEGKAFSEMTRDGVNNVAFQIGGDTFVASGRDLDVRGVPEWATVRLDGALGHVKKVDKEVVAPGAWWRWGLGGGALGLVAMPVTALALGALWGMPGLREFAAFAGVGAAVFGAAGSAIGSLTRWWNGVQAGRDKLAPFVARG